MIERSCSVTKEKSNKSSSSSLLYISAIYHVQDKPNEKVFIQLICNMEVLLLSTSNGCLNIGLMQSSENEKRFLGCGRVESKVSNVSLQNRKVGIIVRSIHRCRDWMTGLGMV